MTYTFPQTLINPVFAMTTNTVKQSTSDTSTSARITINGSTLAYTPHPKAQKVVYEIAFSAERLNDWTFQIITIQESTNGGVTWADFGERTLSSFGHSGTADQSMRWYHHFRHVFPAYTGERSYRVTIGNYQTGRQCDYHALSQWDGTTTTTKFTNTSLIMHSIL